MKKIIAIMLAAASAALIFTGCASKGDSGSESSKPQESSKTETSAQESSEESSEIPVDVEDVYSSISEDVDYYGCPNSDRVKKLNLLKKKRKI